MNIKINNSELSGFFLTQKVTDLLNSFEFLKTTYEFDAYYVLLQHKKVYGA